MRKILKPLIIGLFSAVLLTNVAQADETLTIAASPVPHAEILKQVKPILKKEGIDLQIREFSDYIQPNLVVEQKQMDANYFQHVPYLEQYNKDHKTDLVELVAVHIEPMGLYASNDDKLKLFVTTKKASNLPQGMSIGVPNDVTNEGRALLLLQANKVITLKPNVKYPTKNDIQSNPYNIKIIELDPAMLPRVLSSKQVNLAVINSNYAIQAKLNPIKDSIFIEDSRSPYANIIAVRPDELNLPKMKALTKALQSKAITEFILKQYNGAVVPVNK
jgi:D-methionine transport system substrate-binding protein